MAHHPKQDKPGDRADEDQEFIPTRRTLLSRLKNWEDSESWQRFFDTYWKLIYSVAIKSGLCDVEAQDVVQETVISVARNIVQFKYDPKVCSFKTWLLQVARSRISNQFRRRRRHPEDRAGRADGAPDGAAMDQIPDPEQYITSIWDEEWQRNLTDAALRRVKQEVDIRQYQIFDFYVLRGWPARKVARTLGVPLGRVYLAKHRISALVRRAVAVLEREGIR